MKVRTRLAPSPTGSPHIGTAYQAMINYAFAKKHGGVFIIRIEDTDQKRYVKEAEEEIFEALTWLGTTATECPKCGGEFGPYRQSERLDLYKKHALELVEKGKAYFCFCSTERLKEVREKQSAGGKAPRYDGKCRSLDPKESKKRFDSGEPAVIRLKVPQSGKTVVEDPIRGKIEFENSEIDDQVLLKSNNYPTYHLAVVVDDHLMQVTHPVRGEEWIPSYPKHKLIYDAFGWEMPIYTHTPIIRGTKREKLGKRFGHSSINWFLEQGYLPEALLNYLSLLGWSHPEEKEFFTFDEFTKHFDLKDLSPVGPVFDLTKLTWLNGEWMRSLDGEVIYKHLLEYAKCHSEEPFVQDGKKDLIFKIIPLVKGRAKTFKEFYPLTRFFFEEVKWEKSFTDKQKEIVENSHTALEGSDSWSHESIRETLANLYDEKYPQIKKKEFFEPLRWSITGSKISPPLFESMEILGRETSLNRFKI
jgi:glutamyl-tRNA synthetase